MTSTCAATPFHLSAVSVPTYSTPIHSPGRPSHRQCDIPSPNHAERIYCTRMLFTPIPHTRLFHKRRCWPYLLHPLRGPQQAVRELRASRPRPTQTPTDVSSRPRFRAHLLHPLRGPQQAVREVRRQRLQQHTLAYGAAGAGRLAAQGLAGQQNPVTRNQVVVVGGGTCMVLRRRGSRAPCRPVPEGKRAGTWQVPWV